MTSALRVAALLSAATASLAASAQSIADATQKSKAALALMQAGKPEQAVPLFKDLSAHFPSEPSFRLNLLVALFKSARYRETVEQSAAVTNRWPDLFPGWMFLGAGYLKLGDPKAAEPALRKALVIQPNDPNARIMLADVLSSTNQWAEAANQYELSAQLLPNNPRVLSGLARSYQFLVWQTASQIVKAAPNSVELLALSAELELDQDRIVPAFQQFRQALVLQPEFPGLHSQIAEIYETTGHPDWAGIERTKEPTNKPCDAASPECQFASGEFRKLAAATTDSPQAIYWQAKAFLALSRQAYASLQKLPPSRESYEAKALNDEKHGRYPEAVTAWKAALQLEPTDPTLQKHVALALCHANDCVSALPLLKRQLTLDPNSAELNYLCGLALNSTRNPADALPYLETATRLDDKFLPAHAALGEAYLEAGKPEQAIPHLKASIAEDETGSRLYQLAHAYQAAGMHDESVIALQNYRELINRRTAESQSDSAITPP